MKETDAEVIARVEQDFALEQEKAKKILDALVPTKFKSMTMQEFRVYLMEQVKKRVAARDANPERRV